MSATADATHVFRALADPTRRRILDRLRQAPLPVGVLAVEFPMSRPAISKHLRLLRQAHLVRERREGRQRVYALDPRPLLAVDGWLEGYRRELRSSLERLKRHVEENPDRRNET